MWKHYSFRGLSSRTVSIEGEIVAVVCWKGIKDDGDEGFSMKVTDQWDGMCSWAATDVQWIIRIFREALFSEMASAPEGVKTFITGKAHSFLLIFIPVVAAAWKALLRNEKKNLSPQGKWVSWVSLWGVSFFTWTNLTYSYHTVGNACNLVFIMCNFTASWKDHCVLQ